MAKLILSGDTSGSVTLESPAVSGTTTLTLPTTSGTVLTSGTNTNFPAGSILQVVNATYSTSATSSSNAFVDTGLTASITPSSSSNKILIIVSQSGCLKYTNNTNIGVKLVRNSTDLIDFSGRAGLTDSAATNNVGTICTAYLDSPSTTSSTTYKTQFNSRSNNATTGVQDNSATSTITLMEIKG